MPPAFVLSQDQTLKFIPGRPKGLGPIDRPLTRASITHASDARAIDGPTPPPAHPFHLLHNLNQQTPKTHPPQRGRAYKPSSQLPSIKIRFAFASVRLNDIGTIIQNYCVFCFGEKEPALGDEAERRTCDAEPGHDLAGHSPEQQATEARERGNREAG